MKVIDLIKYLEREIPLDCQEPWDHSGLQLGSVNQEIQSVLITLNVDEKTIEQAIAKHANVIISHHPFLFHPVHTIDTDTIFGRNIRQLLNHQICVYSMHTNYDALRMNTMLLEKLGCFDIIKGEASGTMRVGRLQEPMSFDAFLKKIKNLFALPCLRWCGHAPEMVNTVSMCAGSGHDFIDAALALSDVYITGDLTYTHAMDVILKKQGAVVDVGHFIEAAFKKDIFDKLSKWADFELLTAYENDYFQIR